MPHFGRNHRFRLTSRAGRSAALVFIAALAACAGSSTPRPAAVAPAAAPTRTTRADLTGPRSTTTFLPADDRAALLRLPAVVESNPPPTLRVQAGDAVEQASPVWRLAPSIAAAAAPPPVPLDPPARMRSWFGVPITWEARPIEAAAAPGTGAGIALVALPPAAGVTAPAVTLDGTPADIRWLAPQSGRYDFASMAGTVGAANPWLHAALAVTPGQPWSLWRARLAAPGREFERAAASAADSVASRLAAQHAEVWGVALQRLARADDQTARRLARRLAGAVDFGHGVVAPVWLSWPGAAVPDDGFRLLLADLLADDLSDRERASRARAWLDSLPAGAAWVLDDAGLRDAAAKRNVSTLALANLSDAPAAASVSLDGIAAPLEMLTIPPLSVAEVRVVARRVEGAHTEGPARNLTVRVGAWRGRITVIADDVPARPPGVPVGPLVLDLNMPAIAAVAAGAQLPTLSPAAEALTAGMLLRRSDSATPQPGDSGWTLYLECMAPPAAANAADADSPADTLRVSFGSPDAPAAEWLVPRIGGTRLQQAGPARPLSVTRSEQPDRWVVWIPVPAAAIEVGSRLRFGIVRELRLPDGSIQRTSWPRPMLPWKDEPARLAVDLTAWDRSEQK